MTSPGSSWGGRGRDEVVAALRARTEQGWDAMREAVRDAVRRAPRPGRIVLMIQAPAAPGGELAVREHVLRTLIARALRSRGECDPASVTLDVSDRHLTGVRVGVSDHDSVVVSRPRVNSIVDAVVRQVLDDPRARPDPSTVRIEVVDESTGLPLPERGALDGDDT